MSQSPARICVPICARRAEEIPPALARAARAADLIEIRLDYLEGGELERAARLLPVHLRNFTRPLILTLRSTAEGGQRELSLAERLSFWRPEGLAALGTLVDLELDLVNLLAEKSERAAGGPDWSRVICSHHDFEGTPVDLDALYERMARTPARVIKLAVKARSITDCLDVFRLLARARREGREMIAIAMGEEGLVTRVLAPARGAFLTYAALDEEHASAPGQISAAEMRDLYRVGRLNEETQITGLIGAPVSHSLSPQMHNAACAALDVNAVYLPLPVVRLDEFMTRMVRPATREIDWRLRGLSVTAPHKSEVLRHLDAVDEAAREIGAVNTIVVEDERLCGYNTDAEAAVAPLREILPVAGARVAVLGAGGAARALLWQLQREGAQVTVFARDVARAGETSRAFGALCRALPDARFAGFDAVINTTPLGTRGPQEGMSPAVSAQLRGARIAYDLVYNPTETLFLREARRANCQTLGGLPMLVLQAAEQFKLWTGRAAPLEVMHAAAHQRLSEGNAGV